MKACQNLLVQVHCRAGTSALHELRQLQQRFSDFGSWYDSKSRRVSKPSPTASECMPRQLGSTFLGSWSDYIPQQSGIRQFRMRPIQKIRRDDRGGVERITSEAGHQLIWPVPQAPSRVSLHWHANYKNGFYVDSSIEKKALAQEYFPTTKQFCDRLPSSTRSKSSTHTYYFLYHDVSRILVRDRPSCRVCIDRCKKMHGDDSAQHSSRFTTMEALYYFTGDYSLQMINHDIKYLAVSSWCWGAKLPNQEVRCNPTIRMGK